MGYDERAAAHALDGANIPYDDLVKSLTERFGLTNNSNKARNLYNKLKMLSTESIEQFADRCRQLTNIAFQKLERADREALILDRFRQGLANPQMRQQLMIANDSTLAEAVQRALRIHEAKIYESDAELQAIEPKTYQKPVCSICNKPNHETKDCKYNAINRPKKFCNRCKVNTHATEQCRKNTEQDKGQSPNTQKDKNKVICFFCGKPGHYAARCYQLPRNQNDRIKSVQCHFFQKIWALPKRLLCKKFR